MADSHIQLEIENWIRTVWMPNQFGQPFTLQRLRLNTGGYFVFDAVSADGLIVANISTSSFLTLNGKIGTAKIHKLRSDMLFLLMVPDVTRLIVLSEENMFNFCLQEKKNGRIPTELEFVHAIIPEYLQIKLLDAKRIAAEEVTPHILG